MQTFENTFIENLPRDVIEEIFKSILENDPLEISKFGKEHFKLMEYSIDEEKKMILDSLYKIYEIDKVPLFEKEELIDYFIKIFPRMKIIFINENGLFYNLNSLEKLCIYEKGLKALKLIKKLNFSILYSNSEKMFTVSIRYNNFKALKWLYSIEIPRKFDFFCYYNVTKNGNFEMLKWLKEKFCYFVDNFSESYYRNCILKGNLEMMKWLKKESIFIKDEKNVNFDSLLYTACESEEFEILKWIYSHTKKNVIEKHCCYIAIYRNNFEILKWLRSQNPPFPWDKDRCLDICENDEIRSYIESLD